VTHYLRDFAESFYLLFGAYIQALAAGVTIASLALAAAWATLPHITRRL
jgi:hypothetical protein